jgi:uncharacterized protein YukE
MGDLDGLAAELGQRAAQVEAAGDQLTRAAAVAIWTSVAADAFHAQVGRRSEQCADIAASLRSAAAAVRAYADAVDVELARLARLARLAEAGVGAAVTVTRSVVRVVGW